MPKTNYIGLTDGPFMTPDYSWIVNQRTLEFSAPMEIDDAARDAGNTTYRTTYLRPGLAMGKVTVGGKLKEYDDGNADGTETLFAILYEGVDLIDSEGNPVILATHGPVMGVCVVGGHIDADKVIGIDANGKADLRATGTFMLKEDYTT